MRLTHLKLAGFKSFVDPTTLHLHGQRIGVVGPNGCGKSNVMESIRWVLGESSAKEMRGDSMSDVIFNGSGNRKPVSRASVELVFDNSLGGIVGNNTNEWSQYAEISVKRVLERDKGSTYYINNTPVRRRDVADLFLGTGLGGRAYAIIGQNTISRIVEAKPEELRIFLEEAAGISKYKERRRETELRLRDTRENLTRVEDIRQELAKQISRLESQALVTEQYHTLQKTLRHLQGQLWLLKKRDASTAWEKSQRQVEKLVNELEAQMAALRKAETSLETLRQQHYAATENVQTAQGKYYEANAEVSNLEQQVRHTQEGRERLTQQLQQMAAQAQKLESQAQLLQENLSTLTKQQVDAGGSEVQAAEALQKMRKALPDVEEAHASAVQKSGEAQKALYEAEQGIRLETTSLQHLDNALQDITQRLQRLVNEQTSMQFPDEAVLLQKQNESEKAQAELGKLEKDLHALQEQEQNLRSLIAELRQAQLAEERNLAQLQAKIESISRIQQTIGHEAKLDGWLKQHGFDKSERLWQRISIETGWETALEAVLGARLNAILEPGKNIKHDQRPPVQLVFCEPKGAIEGEYEPAGMQSLVSMVGSKDAGLRALMQDWLSGIYVVDEDGDPQQQRTSLNLGEMLVNKRGDLFTRYSMTLYAPQSALHGVLERQKELTALQAALPDLQTRVATLTEQLKRVEDHLHETQETYRLQQQALKAATHTLHATSLEMQRLQQQQKHVLERQQTLQAEQQAAQQRAAALSSEREQKLAVLDKLRAGLGDLQSANEQAQNEKRRAEIALNTVRSELQQAERLAQEKSFNLKIIQNSIKELEDKLKVNSEERESLRIHHAETEALLAATTMEGLKANLEAALKVKQQRETELASARDGMAGAEQELQSLERMRMQTEQQLHPLRDKLEQARLQDQEARLYFEQCQASLAETGLDEAVLALDLTPSIKVSDLQRSVEKTHEQIEELGPVNLAAIQELTSERERKVYLDSQAQDLEEAVMTLEDAIRRIDRETRSRLQQTFEEVNRNFGELFAVLFGGGQARLELLGEEILDTGMQVFAQPPGKKNSSIHLLSGGEKALTALALV
ncbi:MAG TPA: chromosome segregation protein SMC, partial [Methylophilaceae bacterium]|nr:chromosome segregation protein SMC [Methylophilaceae bacterium]